MGPKGKLGGGMEDRFFLLKLKYNAGKIIFRWISFLHVMHGTDVTILQFGKGYTKQQMKKTENTWVLNDVPELLNWPILEPPYL